MSLACVGGWKWMEYSSAEDRRVQLRKTSAQFQKEIEAIKKAEKAAEDIAVRRVQLRKTPAQFQKEMEARGKVETMAKVIAVENERLRTENASLVEQLKGCKKVPETKRVVPREGKPRTPKAKACEKKVASKPKAKAPIPPKAVAPAPQAEKVKEPCPAGETLKITAGRWKCVKDEPKSPTEAPPIVVAAPETSSFAKAIDEEIGAQVAVPTSNVAAVQVPLQVRCPAYIDSNGMLVPEGYRRVPGGGRVRCK